MQFSAHQDWVVLLCWRSDVMWTFSIECFCASLYMRNLRNSHQKLYRWFRIAYKHLCQISSESDNLCDPIESHTDRQQYKHQKLFETNIGFHWPFGKNNHKFFWHRMKEYLNPKSKLQYVVYKITKHLELLHQFFGRYTPKSYMHKFSSMYK